MPRFALGALCLWSVALQAQDTCGPNDLVPWLPRWYQEARSSVGQPDRAAMEANHAAVEAIVKKTAYGTPRGLAVRSIWNYLDAPPRNQVRTYSYGIYGFVRCNKYDEHMADLTVTFNPHPQLWSESDRPMPDENGDG